MLAKSAKGSHAVTIIDIPKPPPDFKEFRKIAAKAVLPEPPRR
jgi:hypothetical protein